MLNVRKPHSYWKNVANIEQELRAFLAERGMPDRMPTRTVLHQAGRADLATAILRYGGGYRALAQRLGLRMANRKPRGYWDDFDHLKQEVFAWIEEHGTAGVMPTKKEVNDVLRSAINQQGGFLAVAERLGLHTSHANRKPDGYWQNFAHVEEALRAFLAESGTPEWMPTSTALLQAGHLELKNAIETHHGGYYAVARNLGLMVRKKPKGYWQDFAHLEEALRAFLAQPGTPERMPTQPELVQAGRADLAGAIPRHGGFPAVASRLGLQMSSKRQKETWDDFAHVEEALRAFLAQPGTPERMPTAAELRQAGHRDLADTIYRHGGYRAVADRLHVRSPKVRKPQHYWQDFAHVEQALRAFLAESDTPERMPTRTELLQAGRADLATVIRRYGGGYRALAQRLELRMGG